MAICLCQWLFLSGRIGRWLLVNVSLGAHLSPASIILNKRPVVNVYPRAHLSPASPSVREGEKVVWSDVTYENEKLEKCRGKSLPVSAV